jgi:hypothetical protein
MRIMVLILALMLAGCAATRDQVAIAMEMGRNNGCFGTEPLAFLSAEFVIELARLRNYLEK